MLPEQAQAIRLIAFDVDGILTDGGLYLSDSGEEFKRFNSLDGHGLKMLKASGVELAIITGRTSRCVELRAHNLGITYLHQGVSDKLGAMQKLLAQLSLPPAAAAPGRAGQGLGVGGRRLTVIGGAARRSRPSIRQSRRWHVAPEPRDWSAAGAAVGHPDTRERFYRLLEATWSHAPARSATSASFVSSQAQGPRGSLRR